MKKKTISLLLSVIMILSAFAPLSVYANDAYDFDDVFADDFDVSAKEVYDFMSFFGIAFDNDSEEVSLRFLSTPYLSVTPEQYEYYRSVGTDEFMKSLGFNKVGVDTGNRFEYDICLMGFEPVRTITDMMAYLMSNGKEGVSTTSYRTDVVIMGETQSYLDSLTGIEKVYAYAKIFYAMGFNGVYNEYTVNKELILQSAKSYTEDQSFRCDVNLDRKINSKDSRGFKKYISDNSVKVNYYALDQNGDGKINATDSRLFKKAFLSFGI